MHVLIIVENLPVPLDRRVWSEALALKATGMEVTVICPGVSKGLEEEEVLEGVRILRHPLPEANRGMLEYVREYAHALWWETRLAYRVWRQRKFDAIHICNPPDLLFLVALPYRLFSAVRLVFDHHDLSPELYEVKFGKRGVGYWLMRAAEWFTFRAANHVISTNESYAIIAKARGGKKDSEVTIVRSGPDLTRFKRPARRATTEGVTVGYVGVIAEQDGVDLLVRSMAHVVNHHRRADVRAVIIGDGPSKADLESLAGELGVSENITFTGFQSGDDLLNLLETVDIGVCPDPYNDYNDKCTMNKVLEYMALSIPVVQFDLAEGRVSAGEAALYAGRDNDPAELAGAILELADNEALRREMGAKGRGRMENALEWRHQVPKLVSVYEGTGKRS